MNLRPTLSRPRRSLVVGLLFASVASLAVGWTAGTVAACGPHSSPSPSAATGKATTGSVPLGVPAYGISSQSGVASGSSGSAAIYPYQIDPSLGVAPENTILATGTGTADVKADGSDRATAMSKATGVALADARAKAQAVASAMGVSITGTYSVSVSSSDNYIYPTSNCAIPMPNGIPVPAAGGSAESGSGTITIAPAPVGSPDICIQAPVATPTTMQLLVTVVVAYRFS